MTKEGAQTQTASKVRRVIKRFLLLLLVFFFLILGGTWIILHLHQDKIKQVLVEEINRYLLIPIDVGGMELGFWRHFPYISLDVRQVQTRESFQIPGQPVLLKAGHLYLKMHPLDIVRKQYRIRKILIEDAELNILLFENGQDNYHIFRSANDTATGSLDIQLDAVGMRQSVFRFRDLATGQDYAFFLQRIDLKGKLSDTRFDASLQGKLEARLLKTGETVILQNRQAELSTILQVDTETGRVQWNDGRIRTEAMTLLTAGNVLPGDTSDSLDIHLSSGEAKLSGLLSLLPENLSGMALKHQCSGEVTYDLRIQGLFGGGAFPSVVLNWRMDDVAMLACPDAGLWIKNLQAHGIYDNKASPSLPLQRLEVTEARFNLAGKPVKASLTMDNLDAPLLSGKVQANIDLEAISACFKQHWPFQVQGLVDLEGSFDLQLAPGWKPGPDWSQTARIDARGALQSGRLSYPEASLELSKMSGSLRLRQGDLLLQGLEASSPDGPLKLDLHIAGLLPWLENPANTAYADVQLEAEALPIEAWFSGNTSKQETAFSLEGMESNIHVKISKIKYGKFEASHAQGEVTYSSSGLIARQISLKTMGGDIFLIGSMIPHKPGQHIQCRAVLKDIDIKALFRQMNDFGQDEITHRHLQGILTAEVDLGLDLDAGYLPVTSSIVALANVQVIQGIVQDYEPLQGLAKFIKAGNLDKVSLAPLRNQIYVRDSRIFIPEMAVNTDAININLSGVHHFDNQIDYNFKVLLSELLGRKAREARKENSEFGVVQDDGLGRTTLFLRMTGTSDKPVFAYDRVGLKQKISRDLDAERKEVKDVLRQEFHWLRQDSLKREQRKKEKRQLRQQEKGEFIYEWEDDSL